MILEIDSHFPQPGIIEHAIEIIKETHGLIVYPTDTVYGLGCDIKDKLAVEKLIKLKGRETSKQFSILVKDLKQLKEYALVNKAQDKILTEYLPGAFTFILKASRKVPEYLLTGEAVGIRIPRSRLCKALVEELGHPIITTSLNLSGEPVITDPQEIPAELAGQIDVILDADVLGSEPSTVVDLSGDSPKILRQGKGKFDIK